MATWFARAFPKGEGFHIVVEGLLEFDVTELQDVPETTRLAILKRLHQFLPERTCAVEVPGAVWLGTFSVDVITKRKEADPKQPGPLPESR